MKKLLAAASTLVVAGPMALGPVNAHTVTGQSCIELKGVFGSGGKSCKTISVPHEHEPPPSPSVEELSEELDKLIEENEKSWEEFEKNCKLC